VSLRAVSGACAAALVAALGASSPAAGATGLGPLIVEPDQGYAAIYALLSSPKHTLDLTMYELRDPQAQQALINDAARGVTVRVLLDKAFHGGPFNQPVFTALSASGVQVHWASTKVSITHQKSFVIDGKKAVIMTGNLTAQYYATARDFSLVDTKKKDVAAIETTFNLDWANTKGTAPVGSDLVWSPGAQDDLVALIESARHTLRVENEEMKAPAIVAALVAAAKRGVDVEITMTRDPDWAGAFNDLKAAGAHVRTYKQSAKNLYIHAKIIVADGHKAFLGSQNFTTNSLQFNRELGLITAAKSVVGELLINFGKDFDGATPW
jgi:phosphatidylserine/phosphatidylglycerophosphate/cardiolipin synthase-like enzyme